MAKSNKKKQEVKKPQRDYTPVRRGLYLTMFSGSLAIGIYLSILVSSPDTGQLVLAGFAYVNAVYHLIQTIK